MAFVTGAFEYDPVAHTQRWDGEKRWVAVVHLFASDGLYEETVVRLGAYDAEGRPVAGAKAWDSFDEVFHELGLARSTAGDINVAPFEVELDGVLYGLIYEHEEDEEGEHEWVMLEPNDVMFHPPWDSGQYST